MGAVLVCLALALGLAGVWRARRWGDAAEGDERARKLQRSLVPAVGGLAIFGAWCAQAWFSTGFELWSLPPFELLTANVTSWPLWIPWSALALALASGALDDAKPGGLGPLAKLCLQVAVGALLAWHLSSPVAFVLLAGLSVLHQNAINTFDNADGAASGLCAAGLLACGSPLAPVVLVFLVPNLLLRTASGDPRAYLGDAGSQLLGLAVLLTPGAWPILALPLFDLARLSVQRARLGIAPWKGDRRHLAHRLQRWGLGPVAVLATLLVLAAPALLAPGAVGIGLSALLYTLAVWRTRAFAEPNSHPMT